MKNILLALLTSLTVTTYGNISYDLDVKTWLKDQNLYGGKVKVSVNSPNYRTVNAGQLLVTFDEDEIPLDQYDNPWLAYCTDVNNNLNQGLWKPLPSNVAEHSPQYQNPDWDGSLDFAYRLFATFAYQIDSDAKAIGLQTAIWEALYDEQFDLNSGWFKAQDAPGFYGALDWAETYLYTPSDLLVDISNRNLVWWEPVGYAGNYRNSQGLISVPNPPNIIPESSTYLLLIPLIGLGIYAFRKQRSIVS
jgi:hypothetical protein